MKRVLLVVLSLLLVISCDNAVLSGILNNDTDDVSLISISFSKQVMSLFVGSKEQLSVTFTPENATNKTITWTSEDVTIASVTTTGIVTAKKIGETKIIATSNDGVHKCFCDIKVVPVLITGITLNKSTTTITVGLTEKLSTIITPTNSTYKNLIWTSSDVSIANVSSDGTITAISVGKTTITVANPESSISTFCVVTVSPILATEIKLNKTATVMLVGATEKLTVEISPINTTDKNTTWSSTNESILTVSETGLVTAVASGTADIKCQNIISGLNASCTVNVKNYSSISIAPLDMSSPHICNRQFYAYGNLPNGMTEDITNNVAWLSSDPTIASIDSSGLLKSEKAGNINVSAVLGSLSSVTSFTVTAPTIVSRVPYITKPGDIIVSIWLNIGQRVQLKGTITYSDNTTEDIPFLSVYSNGTWGGYFICNNGIIEGIKSGTDYIKIYGETYIVQVN